MNWLKNLYRSGILGAGVGNFAKNVYYDCLDKLFGKEIENVVDLYDKAFEIRAGSLYVNCSRITRTSSIKKKEDTENGYLDFSLSMLDEKGGDIDKIRDLYFGGDKTKMESCKRYVDVGYRIFVDEENLVDFSVLDMKNLMLGSALEDGLEYGVPFIVLGFVCGGIKVIQHQTSGKVVQGFVSLKENYKKLERFDTLYEIDVAANGG